MLYCETLVPRVAIMLIVDPRPLLVQSLGQDGVANAPVDRPAHYGK